MKTLLKTKTGKVASFLGFKLWIAINDSNKFSLELKRTRLHFFKIGVQFGQSVVNEGLTKGFIS